MNKRASVGLGVLKTVVGGHIIAVGGRRLFRRGGPGGPYDGGGVNDKGAMGRAGGREFQAKGTATVKTQKQA